MNSWLHRIEPKLTLQGIPSLRRHCYFLAVLFLATTVTNQALNAFNSGEAGLGDSAEAHELARLQEMAATAWSLYK